MTHPPAVLNSEPRTPNLERSPANPERKTGIVIVDFGLGNLRSVSKALEHLGFEGRVTSDFAEIEAAEKLILPGDGAFGAAMANLNATDESGRSFAGVIRGAASAGTPILGICVGMQVLLDESEEFGHHQGLGLIAGGVRKFPEGPGLKIPQIGWNNLNFTQPECPLFDGLTSGDQVYFIHSFYCAPVDSGVVAASTVHGIEYCSILHAGNIYATQFHPEKSGEVGVHMLGNFLRL